jgi:hypothetical protein
MNPNIVIKQHLQILGGAILLIFFFAEGFILDKKPVIIRTMKTQITKLTQDANNYVSLQEEKKSLEEELDESRSNIEEFLTRFPNHANTENERSSLIATISSRLIVNKEKLIPKKLIPFAVEGVEPYSVPKIQPTDENMTVKNVIQIANYKYQMDIRSNYFELLQFLHDLANQDMFFFPIKLKMRPNLNANYGILTELELLTFGFEGFAPEKKR